MVNFFRKMFASDAQLSSSPLHFKDGRSAFDYACQFLGSELVASAILPALVEDARLTLNAESDVIIMEDGTQMLALRVCSKDGGFLVLAGALSPSGPKLKPGDLVAWQAGKSIKREVLELNRDPRSSWVGIALAKLKPEYSVGRGWAIHEPFRE